MRLELLGTIILKAVVAVASSACVTDAIAHRVNQQQSFSFPDNVSSPYRMSQFSYPTRIFVTTFDVQLHLSL